MTQTYSTERIIQNLRTVTADSINNYGGSNPGEYLSRLCFEAADRLEELSGIDPGLVKRAERYMDEVLQGLLKLGGAPMSDFPRRVAKLLREHGMDDEMVAAGLVVGLLSRGVTWDELAGRFGNRVADVAQEVQSVSRESDGDDAARSTIEFEHLRSTSEDAQSLALALAAATVVEMTENLDSLGESLVSGHLDVMRRLLQVLTKGDIGLWERALAAILQARVALQDIEKKEAA